MSSLDKLATKYGTDKGPNGHHYTKWYADYFDKLRSKQLTILELGWGGHEDPDKGGASAQMWRDYFTNGTVVCVDIEEKKLTKAHNGIHFRQGSQNDPTFLKGLTEEFGGFDIIIDDASHLSSLTIASWKILYPYLNDQGIYVVEDTHMSYHDWYYGKNEANENPRATRNGGFPTAMQYFQWLSDEVNFKGRDAGEWDLFPKKYWMGYELDWIHFYFNILFIKKNLHVK